MEESSIGEQVKKWLAGIEILNPGSYIKVNSATADSHNDSGISVSSSDNPYEELVSELEGYLDFDDKALEEMYKEIGKGTSSTVTSCSLSPGIDTHPTRDDFLRDTYYNPFIKPVYGDLTIDDKEHDGVEVKVVDVSKVDTGKSGHGFGDWIIRSNPDITTIKKDAPSVHFNDVTEEGNRFLEAANTSPAPKPVPVKDTEFTRLWNKLNSI